MRITRAVAARHDSWRQLQAWRFSDALTCCRKRIEANWRAKVLFSLEASVAECTLGRNSQQLRCSSDVIGCIGIAGVTEICRQQWQQRLNVSLLPMPALEPCDDESMTKVMRPE